jgi:hypothetical protein
MSNCEEKFMPIFTIHHSIEPTTVTHKFSSFSGFKQYMWAPWEKEYSLAPLGDVLMLWHWQPSLIKAKYYNLRHVTDFFNDLDDDDEYKNGLDALPQNDYENHLVYREYDYLLLYVQRISNGFFTRIYKITVTDNDEPEIRKMLHVFIDTTIKQINI